ncbi:hypothetical protein P167DRAFT_575002 [Morchella conica CCBAS932]|uniref:Uncharacterized protein n=1 Tax=Morchella conica CCBAS932 TaxID=1392247 RepID=A0A3N4KTY0_9PEZI|nr:hypothetical protein P167DRAFT_575002 [Morchella conica CCBAS932]
MVRKKQPKKTPAATKKGKKTLRSSNSKQNAEPEPELENKNLGPKISEPEIPKSENSDSELPVFTAPTSPAGGTSQKEEIEKINLPQSSATDFGPPPGLSFSSSPPTSSPLSSSSPSNEPLPEGFKRCHLSTDDDESSDGGGTPTKKAKLTAAPLKKPNVAEENILLLSLKDEKNMKWPDIVEAFREHGWAGRKQTLLKNRYRSLKEGIVFWEDDDASPLLPPRDNAIPLFLQYFDGHWVCLLLVVWEWGE